MPNLPSFYRPGLLWNRSSEGPFRGLSRIQQQIDRLFDEFTASLPEEMRAQGLNVPDFSPACDVEETDTHYVLSFDLPGIKREDIKIELVNNVLRVSGERKEEHGERKGSRYQTERFYGTFTRSFTLPSGIKPEQIETEYSDGVLRVAVPRAEASQVQQIKIGGGKPGFFQKLSGQKKEEPKRAA